MNQETSTTVTPEQMHILHHSLGITSKRSKSYRNHFVTGPGSKDYDNCVALVSMGYMTQRSGTPLTGGNDLFQVTDAGRHLAIQAKKEL